MRPPKICDRFTKFCYSYRYDPLNRITAATGGANINYDVSNISYDKMGNIQTLKRNGYQGGTDFMDMDILSYEYQANSNKLVKVSDDGNKAHGFKEPVTLGNDYRYDDNGNMLIDKNKGIGMANTDGISYNHLNLPVTINVTNAPDIGVISYVYDATGVKLEKTVSGTSSGKTDYAGNYIYENGSLAFFSTPEGYVTPNTTGGYDYVYQYKDHLGNVRLSYTEDPSNPGEPTIIEENNYYPFGLEHKGYNNVVSANANSTAQNWRYQGQELTEDLGLNTYEFRYRMHDPSIGRFWQIDPLGEEYSYQSPYNFAENRVIDGIELEGLEWMSIKDDDDEITGYKWVGYNDDGTAIQGSVGDAALVLDSGNVIHFKVGENSDGEKTSAVSILTPNENGMVQLPESGTTFNTYNRNDEVFNGVAETDGYGTAENVANFINLSGLYESEFRGNLLEFGDLSTETGNSPRYTALGGKVKRHGTHYNGTQADIRYTNSSGQTVRGGRASAGMSDPARVQTLVKIANSLGMDHIHLGTALRDKVKGQGVNFNSGHNDHIHIGKGNGKSN